MALSIASIASGSNGNCYYIGNEEEAVLIDAGISCREIERRMFRLKLAMSKVKAVFISHEHSDHICGLAVLSKKHNIPVFITDATRQRSQVILNADLSVSFPVHQPVAVGSLSVTAFPKWHDACDPHSFTVTDNEVTVGIFTDIGAPCPHVIRYFNQCHAAFLEANYDDGLLTNGRYPYHLKARIRSQHGHLSNIQALELFNQHRSAAMSHLLLSHLSKDNNSPELAADLFNRHAGNTQIIIASRYKETAVYKITGEAVLQRVFEYVCPYPEQLSLF